MSQTFRTPPRQIGFKSAGPAAPRLTQVPAASGSEARLRQLLNQLQQAQTKYKLQQERLSQLKVPSARQQAEAQLQQLRKEIGVIQQSLLQLRGQLRLERLKDLETDGSGPAESLRFQLAEIEAIYRVHQPLPQRLLPLLDDWLKAFRQLYERRVHQLPQQPADAEAAETALAALQRELWPPEAEQLQLWWRQQRPELLDSAAEQQEEPPPPPETAMPGETALATTGARAADDFEVLSFENQGPLELRFDTANRRPVVRNQMGITLNAPKQSYQAYLETGFAAIDTTVASQFQQREPLYAAVEAFLEAVSLDRSRYEAYFGLGYLYSLVKDVNHALYFLDLAFRISGDPAIAEMIEKVKLACQVPA